MSGSNEAGAVVDRFVGEFMDWLAVSQPDVHEEMQLDEDGGLLPESVPTALEYVDEFVAQSDSYPLTEPVLEQ